MEASRGPDVARAVSGEHRYAGAIAIVGIGCRLPSDIRSWAELWRLLVEGKDAVREIPHDRWDVDAYYDPDPGAAGKICTRNGGFLKDKDLFDPQFFKISPREATYMDPQQRLLLEVAWEAIEDANIPAESLYGSDGGVFVGISGFDYANLVAEYLPEEEVDPSVGTGGGHSPASGRLSYVFGLRGPSISLDTACSSSLVAVHAACKSLRDRECSFALAGGVNMILSPFNHIVFSRARMLSGDGRCKAFDDSADGYGRSEGAGLLMLKRLEDAVADDNRIHAIIRGGAVNQDGPSGGLTVPNGPAQQQVVKRALKDSGLTATDIDYVEAHGTGTSLGDPIEINALAEVFRHSHTAERPLIVGSAKTNLGHMESAAGIGGILKVVLQLKHRTIAPHLHFQNPSSRIAWDRINIAIPGSVRPWLGFMGNRRRAGVSSFGFSGTNAHLILEEAPDAARPLQRMERPKHILTLSAKNDQALKDLAAEYLTMLDQFSDGELADICGASNNGRTHFSVRAVVISDRLSSLKAQLSNVYKEDRAEASLYGEPGSDVPKVAFLFTGQGSQYKNMAYELFQSHPAFRDCLIECDHLLSAYSDWSALDVLFGESRSRDLNQTLYAQPLLFMIEFALARLWQSWGVEPTAVMGHSVGEYAAAAIAGVFSLADGIKLIAARARLMQSLPRIGGMLFVQAPFEEVTILRADFPELAIAAINGPRNIVLSGLLTDLEHLEAVCRQKRIVTMRLEVSHAFHSSLMEPVLEEFGRIAHEIEYFPPSIPIVSNLQGKFAMQEMTSPDYWIRHVSSPVRFQESIEFLSRQPNAHTAFLEIGPKPTLTDIAKRYVEGGLSWLPSLHPNRGDWDQMLTSLGRLYVRGCTIKWSEVNRYYCGYGADLPKYPFQRSRFWFAPHVTQRKLAKASSRKCASLLGKRVASEIPEEMLFERVISAEHQYLLDHQIFGEPIFPAAGYLELALEAGEHCLPGGSELRRLQILRPLALRYEARVKLRTRLIRGAESAYSAEISAQASPADDAEEWTTYARIQLVGASGPTEVTEDLTHIRERITERLDTSHFYDHVRESGLEYGASFQTIKELFAGSEEAYGRVAVSPEVSAQTGEYCIHPTLLDGAFQILGATLPDTSSPGSYLPVGIDRIQRLCPPGTEYWVHVSMRSEWKGDQQPINVDIRFYTQLGAVALIVSGLQLLWTSRTALKRALQHTSSDILYSIDWVRLPPQPEAQKPENNARAFLIFADNGGKALQVADNLRRLGYDVTLVHSSPGAAIQRRQNGSDDVDPSSSRDIAHALENYQRVPATILCFWSLDIASSDRSYSSALLHSKALLDLLKAVTAQQSRPWQTLIFTCNAFPLWFDRTTCATATALCGLCRAVRSEYPSLELRVIDIEQESHQGFDEQQVLDEIMASDGEEDVALRRGMRFVPRLKKIRPADPRLSGGRQIEISELGAFENLRLEPVKRKRPDRDEVEVQVHAAGINFKDILFVLGVLKQHALDHGIEWIDHQTLGFECAGVVIDVGEGVFDRRVGDRVICYGTSCLSSFVTLRRDATILCPESIPLEQGAAIPTAFLTAHHALHTLAKIRPGDKVLIHAGAGSVGQAAIQLCRAVGAEIFATASRAKWSFLRTQGVKHIMNSRDALFKEEILEATNGAGVDIVLNSLNGDIIPASLAVVAPGGRFVEIGKIGIWSSDQVATERPDVAYYTFDLSEESLETQSQFSRSLEKIVTLMDNGRISVPFVEVFSVEDIGDAFRHLAHGNNIGKVVTRFSDISAPINGGGVIRPTCSYWITGGLGGLGLKTAAWLVEKGARYLVLSGRNEPSAQAASSITEMRRRGANIEIIQADVSREDDVVKVLNYIAESMPPLHGIHHAAGVLDDRPLATQCEESLERVFAPKVFGTWNLDKLTRHLDLGHFITFSSVSAILGSPGQANYAAANAFMDGLIAQRRKAGLAGLSVNWGPWANTGMAASLSPELRERMRQKGVESISSDQALSALHCLMESGASQAIASKIGWKRFAQQYVVGRRPPKLLANLTGSTSDGTDRERLVREVDLSCLLACTAENDRAMVVLQEVQRIVAHILRLPSPESAGANHSLGDLGLDSLMAVEARTILSAAFKVELSTTLLFDYPTVGSVAKHIFTLLYPNSTPSPIQIEVVQSAVVQQLLSDLHAMSGEAIERALLN